jgi:hypothetical protein
VHVRTPEFTNCTAAISSPGLAPPGITRTVTFLHVVRTGGGGVDVDVDADAGVDVTVAVAVAVVEVCGAVDESVMVSVGIGVGDAAELLVVVTGVGVREPPTGCPDDVQPAISIRVATASAAPPHLTDRSGGRSSTAGCRP